MGETQTNEGGIILGTIFKKLLCNDDVFNLFSMELLLKSNRSVLRKTEVFGMMDVEIKSLKYFAIEFFMSNVDF